MKFESKAQLSRWALDSERLSLFLDYDGTLSDFAPTPDHIEPNPEIIDVLERLAGKAAYRLTILSGRRLEHIRRLLPISGIFLAGTYGIEFVTPAGDLIQRVEYDLIRPMLEALKPQWERTIAGREGFFLEDKGWTLALHARFADDEEAEQVMAQARRAASLESLTKYFRTLGGHKFFEIVPEIANKREAVAYLLAEYPLAGARLLYIGDDDKDEEAFPVIHAHQGIAVKVRQPSQISRPTSADFIFESPGETLRWLQTII